MDLEELTSALAAHDADPGNVKAALAARRRRSTRARALAGAAACVGVAAAVLLAVQPWAAAPQRATASPAGAADGCAVISLRDTFATALQRGASVITGTGVLTSRTASFSAAGPGSSASAAGTADPGYYQLRMTAVRTLSGPRITAGSAWLDAPEIGADAGSLWAPGGSFFAIAWPARVAGTPAGGPELRIAPLVGGDVIFSSAGCWDTDGVRSQAFHGQLAEIPGYQSYARAAQSGFRSVPLTAVEQLLPR